ncbi:TPA: galactose mutarotase [Streptococcus suis]|uniref:aldose epimerase family protein n=1 Tax=Streptococcus suis TaxID=1307 RepID=UPI0002077649|nr:aldose epimerase family protein [Streptococcus suis]AEB80942.1 galactose mutarotase-like protein [Streptococcus suis ST3]AGW86844.1 Aldose 1-epimerase [Streptococcus suis YB51]NQG49091.1 galactose mutarotase [Streptococcus suis]QDS24403.1 galactose mutarotase [Streptococcus suis]CYW45617.1 galactose mutarotase-like protein [Streptococcus suis]
MIEVKTFGEKAKLYCLENKNGMQVTLTDFGARVVEVLLPVEENGGLRNVSLAAKSDDDYRKTDLYPGSTIIPVAGRISGAQAEIKGTSYHFTENEPGRTLHGGVDTANEQYWDVELDHERNQVTFGMVLKDGFNGFPGDVRVKAIYRLTDKNELTVDYQAVSDKDTIFNPTNHIYFNLTGDFQRSVAEHRIKIAANHYAPLGEDNLPTGVLEDVTGTPFDFRDLAPFAQGFDSQYPQNVLVKGYDHPWLLEEVDIPVEVLSPDGKIGLSVKTNQPAVVIYTYNFPVEALACYHGVFSLECQALPNACNVDGFGSILLEQGEEFLSKMTYRFTW